MFYICLLIFLLNDGFSMIRHYSPYLRDVRQRLMDRMTRKWFLIVHSTIDILAVGGMIYLWEAKYVWVLIAVPVFMITWYIPLWWRKRKA